MTLKITKLRRSGMLFLLCLLWSFSVNAQTIVATFNYTGTIQSYTVPAGVNQLIIEAFGAQGKSAQAGMAGGMGARMKGTFNVTPGTQLLILTGGEGIDLGGSGGGGGGTFVVKVDPDYYTGVGMIKKFTGKPAYGIGHTGRDLGYSADLFYFPQRICFRNLDIATDFRQCISILQD